MKPVKTILPALMTFLMLLSASSLQARAVPTPRDKDNYERLLAIILTATKENRKAAKDTLRGMGEVGIALLKADCKDIESTRGTLAWSLLKEFIGDSDKEALLEFARKGLVDLARKWALSYTKRKSSKARQKRLGEVVGDYVDFLAASPKSKDFDLLLKALRYSLITGDRKADYGREFEVWQKLWDLLGTKIKTCDSVKVLEGWRKVLDGHFRAYSLRKDYVDRKAIRAYHAATLLFIQRIDTLNP